MQTQLTDHILGICSIKCSRTDISEQGMITDQW